MEFDWPVDDRQVSLRAAYPDSFPRIRPSVWLRTDRESWPARHCSPIDGNLCVLGRDSRQWVASLTLQTLLDEQLANTLNGTGPEDRQGEPAEIWWNSRGSKDSYCLINSDWELGEATCGTLRVNYWHERIKGTLRVHAAVIEVRDNKGAPLATWNGVLPQELKQSGSCNKTTIPWALLNNTPLPTGNPEQITDLWNAHDYFRRFSVQPFGHKLYTIWFALAYESELGFQVNGLSWLFPLVYGPKKRFVRRASRSPDAIIVPTYRAGISDVGNRVPGVACLRNKRIAVFGLGALGAPLAVELARNGCQCVHLIDHDCIEPGNSIRWPLGATSWGKAKVSALSAFMGREYPGTDVIPHEHNIGISSISGSNDGDEELFSTVLEEVDLVVDATASYGVTNIISDHCRENAIPLVVLFASPTVEGGVVARFDPTDGCPTCLEYAWHTGSINKAPGLGADEGLQQPPGCAELTFTGASYDLQELSLQAIRLVVETLGESDGTPGSLVQTLSLVDANGQRVPPQWCCDPLPKHPDCSCSQAR